jgi:hypothetical protein
VTLNIAPLLSLNADQSTKLDLRRVTDKVVPIHWDQYRQAADLVALEADILSASSTVSIVLFSSPQLITDNPARLTLLKKLVAKGQLNCVCIDEAHLVVEFGLYFRPEFVKLKSVLFRHLLVPGTANETTCPVIFMTASATKLLVNQLTQLTGFSFTPSDVFWPDAAGMACRRQTIRFMPHAQPIRLFKQVLLAPLLLARQQFIYYSNRRVNVERASKGIRSHLDASDHDGDIVTIIGPFSRDQKFHRTQLFLNPSSLTGDIGTFKAVGCVTTRSLGAAGWDSDLIHLVFSSDMVTSLLSVLQEKGRAGRRVGADGSDDTYFVGFDLDDYLYLVKRACAGEASTDVALADFASLDTTLPEYTKLQLADYMEVLNFFILPSECQHSTLERKLCNPFIDSSGVVLAPCSTLCQYCIDNGQVHKSFERFVRDGVQQALVQLFFSEERLLEPSIDGDEALIVALTDYPFAQRLFFDSGAAKKPQKAAIKRLLLLLITADLIRLRYVTKVLDDERLEATLIAWIPFLPSSCSPVLIDDSRWARLPLKEPKDVTIVVP